MSTVVVAGGGPTGLVAALLLAQRGHHVKVFEKREDPRQQDYSLAPPRTLFWGINARGQAALAQTKVQLPQKQGERLGGMTKAGSMDLILQGAKSSSGQTAPPRAIEPQSPNGIFAARAEFVQHLAHEIQRLHPDRVQLNFQHSLKALDWGKQQATFQDASGAEVAETYDLLIGADGVHSKTRQLYQQHNPKLRVTLKPAPKDYVGFSGISAEGYESDSFGAKQPVRDHRGLHLKVWLGSSDSWTVLFSANSRGSLTGHLSALRPAIGPVDSREEYQSILEREIPHMPACLREPIAAAVVGGHKSPLGTSGYVSSLVGPHMALLGDAAHSLNPIMGQGVNSAMQDAAVLCQMLDESGQDVDAALQRYERERHPEILALHSMDLASTAWAGQEGPWHPLKLAKQFHDFLQKWRAERRGVSVMQMPHMAAFAGLGSYSQANAAWEQDRNIFFTLLGAAALLLVGLARAAVLSLP